MFLVFLSYVTLSLFAKNYVSFVKYAPFDIFCPFTRSPNVSTYKLSNIIFFLHFFCQIEPANQKIMLCLYTYNYVFLSK